MQARLKMRFTWPCFSLYQLGPASIPATASSAGWRQRIGPSRTAAARSTTSGRRRNRGAGYSSGSRRGVGSGWGIHRSPGWGTAARRGSDRRGRGAGSRGCRGSRRTKSSGLGLGLGRGRRTGGRRRTSSIVASGSRRRGRTRSRWRAAGMRRGVRGRSTCRRSPSSSIRSLGSAENPKSQHRAQQKCRVFPEREELTVLPPCCLPPRNELTPPISPPPEGEGPCCAPPW